MASLLSQCSHNRSHIGGSAASRLTRNVAITISVAAFPLPFKGEIALALPTANFREAEHLAHQLNRALTHFMSTNPPLDPKSIDALRAYLREALNTDEEMRRSTPPGQSVYTRAEDSDNDPVDRTWKSLKPYFRRRANGSPDVISPQRSFGWTT